MKLIQASYCRDALQTMLNQKGVVGLKIMRNLRMLNEELQEYDKFRLDLFEKYGELGEDGIYRIEKDTENCKKFEEEMKPLNDQEAEFNFRMLTDEELEGSELTAEQMIVLDEFMVEH